MTTPSPSDIAREMTVTALDPAVLTARLEAWLSARSGSPARVTGLTRPETNGLSSVSLLFHASWADADGAEVEADLVARIPPDDSAFPVFPTYDLRRQYDVISAVYEHSDVPVPKLITLEESTDALGSPFIVMERVEGDVPIDNPPYVFFGWFFDAAPEQRRALQDATIAQLARLHEIPAARIPLPATTLTDLVAEQREYYGWTRRVDGMAIPLIDEMFAWLEAHYPDSDEQVLSWGDARIGNVIYRDFRPVAVLDWEMCALGPRELDIAWFVHIHDFFQWIANLFEQPGLPDVCRRDDVVAEYQRVSGRTLRDLDWYFVFAALRYAIVMSQIKRRMIHFGEDTAPATPDEYVMQHPMLRAMLDGLSS